MEGRIMQMIIDPLPEVTKAAEMKRKQGKKEKGKKGKKGEEEEEEEDKEVEAMLAAQDAEDDSENDDEDAAGHDIDYDIDELSEAEVQVKIIEVPHRLCVMPLSHWCSILGLAASSPRLVCVPSCREESRNKQATDTLRRLDAPPRARLVVDN